MTKVGIFSMIAAMLLVFGLHACRKFEEYPPEPNIAFNDFVYLIEEETGISKKGILSITYRDGDGNIGLEQSDTVFPFQPDGDFYYNLLIVLSEKQNGVFVDIPVNFNSRIPLLIPKDQTKSIKGIIENEVDIYDPGSEFDTIMFRIKLIDRSLNISNEVFSPEIVRIHP